MQLFLDLDGVLADFDGFYEYHFGCRLPRELTGGDPPGMWDNIRSHGSFYRSMPVLPDALTLWEGTKHLNPIILTGVPYSQVPDAHAHKTAWVAEHFGATVPIICCKSKDKCLHGKPGDVLIDDWPRYKSLWIKMGGTFIRHTSARKSLQELSSFL